MSTTRASGMLAQGSAASDWLGSALRSLVEAGRARLRRQDPRLGLATFYPDYRRSNPYQHLLYGEVKGFRLEPGTIAIARQRLAASAGRDRVFHLHWTSPILGRTAHRATALRRMKVFLDEMLAFREEGGWVVWTIHNILPHECRHRELEIELRRRLCDQADVIHVHGPQVPALAAPSYAIPQRKVVVGAHGSYVGIYPRGVTSAGARRQLGLPDDATVLLFLGQLRAYKGLDHLVAAYRAIKRRNLGLRLLIAGQPFLMPDNAVAALARGDPDIRIEPRRIGDAEIQVFFAAADVAVLPYSSVLTSGAAYLALSFGTPVIAPRMGLLPNVIVDGVNGFLYPQPDRGQLELAIQRYVDLPAETRANLRLGATESAARLDWREPGDVIMKAFQELIGGQPAAAAQTPRCAERPPAAGVQRGSQHGPQLHRAPPMRICVRTNPLREAEVNWWRPGRGGENFGDFLSLLLWQSLFSKVRIEAPLYHVIGSVIDTRRIRRTFRAADRSGPGKIAFWGCGSRSGKGLAADVRRRSLFCGVRGPLTRDALKLPLDTPLGDPGLLLPLIYQPRQHPDTSGKAVCVPHINDPATSEELISVTGADHVLSPNIEGSDEALHSMIDGICSASFVLAGSLHSAIVACAYDVPFCYFDAGHRDIPFKWTDFSASVNIGTFFARNVHEGRVIHRTRIAPHLRRPSLQSLLACAPFWVKPEPLQRARFHEWGAVDGDVGGAG